MKEQGKIIEKLNKKSLNKNSKDFLGFIRQTKR
jgi:hypothetical protein